MFMTDSTQGNNKHPYKTGPFSLFWLQVMPTADYVKIWDRKKMNKCSPEANQEVFA